ncbi:MAG: peptidoglycan-binding domain-containing protein [Chthoniobacterales bacterium]
MNLNKLVIIGGIALAIIAVPSANAQRGHRGGNASRSGISRSSSSGAGARSFQTRTRGNGRFSASSSGARFGNGRGRGYHWDGGRRGRYRGYYPYYSSYPYGYGFGYPFFGTSFYYGSDYPGYSSSSDGGSVVVAVQQELARAGYYNGSIDGIAGNGTRSAIRRYERATGLSVDGRIDSDLLSAMGIR